MLQIQLKPLLSGFFFIYIFSQTSFGQVFTPGFQALYFTNKPLGEYTLTKPEAFLSQESIERKLKQKVPFDSLDLPVSETYIQQIKDLGAEYINQSRWLNGGIFLIDEEAIFRETLKLPFIKSTTWLAPSDFHSKYIDTIKGNSIKSDEFIEQTTSQLAFTSANFFTEKNITGEGMHIAILDAGFKDADNADALKHVFENDNIKHTLNLIAPEESVYTAHSHGTSVWSLVAGRESFGLLGSAPNATYSLILSENFAQEFLIEEFYWVIGAEFADSIGADIINSSLGYFHFDSISQNHTYSELNGETTIVAKGAKTAWDKGIFVINSAGNEAEKDWRHIISPADVPSILTVGSTAQDSTVSDFSSIGFDRTAVIKPDIVCLGEGAIGTDKGGITHEIGGGTSFSAPLVTGAVACLKAFLPEFSNDDIKNAIVRTSHLAKNKNTSHGNGIPNFKNAYYYLINGNTATDGKLLILPNPAKTSFELIYTGKENNEVTIEIRSIDGALLWHKSHTETGLLESFSFKTEELGISPGIYYCFVRSEKQEYFTRFVVYN